MNYVEKTRCDGLVYEIVEALKEKYGVKTYVSE